MEAGGFEPPDSHSIRYSRPADIVVWCPVIRTYVGGASGLKGQYQKKLLLNDTIEKNVEETLQIYIRPEKGILCRFIYWTIRGFCFLLAGENPLFK
jgi:hypothetical protein